MWALTERSIGRSQGNGRSDCLPKTQGYANQQWEVYSLTRARCRKVNAPVNGGRNYNGPKVAKFLVG